MSQRQRQLQTENNNTNIRSSPTKASYSDTMSASSSSSSHTLIPSPPIHAPVPQTRPLRKYPSNLSRSGAQTPSRPGRDETKYENLEDLLREAGYKETRIFTPESERNVKDSNDSGILSFISGLLSRPTTPSPMPERSSTPSEGDPTPRPSYRPIVLNHSPPPSPPPRLQERESLSSLKRPSSRLNNSFTTTPSTSSHLHAPRPSPAVAHLRHMASNTSIQSSRSTPLARTRSTRSVRTITNTTGQPLPERWMDNVNQAVVARGGRVGRPPAEDGPLPRGRPPTRLLPSRRSASVAASVTKVGVVCRSVPSSPVRGTQSVFGKKNKGKGKANVPSLRAQQEGSVDGLSAPVSPSSPVDDDDDDEVLDLARLLVPPKRQNSIASLRRHLLSGQPPNLPRYRTWNGGDAEEASEDEEDFMRLVSGHNNGGANRKRSGERRRLALPPPWNS